MKTMQMMAVVAPIVGTSLALYAAHAQQGGIKHIDIQRHDLSATRLDVLPRVDADVLSRAVVEGRK